MLVFRTSLLQNGKMQTSLFWRSVVVATSLTSVGWENSKIKTGKIVYPLCLLLFRLIALFCTHNPIELPVLESFA
jgi:hypothetical protein